MKVARTITTGGWRDGSNDTALCPYPLRCSVHDISHLKLIGVAGKAGAGKDTFYEHVLKPRGFLRWQMTLHYKVWLHATGRFSWPGIFDDKPPDIRKVLQQELTALRHERGEAIWLNTLNSWMRALFEIVGVEPVGIAITDLREVSADGVHGCERFIMQRE
jgi:hypothetical protein